MTTATTSEHLAPSYNPFEFYENPYPVFQRLRREAPAYYNASLDLWVLSRFEDVHTAARDRRTFSSAQGVALDDESDLYSPGAFLDYDPPGHDRLRAAMAAHFTPRTIQHLEMEVRTKVKLILAPHVELGYVDFAADIARPLPASVVCTLLGFPREDHERLLNWFAIMIDKESGSVDFPPEVWTANREMRDYVRESAMQRRSHPKDDLLTVLAVAEQRDDITLDELVGMSIFVFYAGIMTTAAFISNSVDTLARHPDVRRLLSGDPTIMPGAIEELLRYDAPVQSVSRVTTEDVHVQGSVIPEGARVLILYGSANRDEERWEDPDRLDVHRERKRNLAFGEGIHHCLGSALARLEGRIVLEELLMAAPNYELLGSAKRLFAPHERGFESLPVSFRGSRA